MDSSKYRCLFGALIAVLPPAYAAEIDSIVVTAQRRVENIQTVPHYPEGYKPELLEEWPVDSDLVVPVDQLPENLKDSMGDRWRQKVRNTKVLEEQK